MYKSIQSTIAVLVAAIAIFHGAVATASTTAVTQKNPETELVRSVVDNAYCQGAFNKLDTVTMATGFHIDFAILGADGEKLDKYTIKDWITAINARKAKPGFDPSTAVRDCCILQIDVTNGVAAVKLEIYRQGKNIYTDYLSLIKFASGWKIVAKVYAEHS